MSAKKLIVVHGYPLRKDGGLGVNKVVLDKAIKLYRTGKYEYILLPAGINEDTGEGNSLIFERHEAYLLDCLVPSARILTSEKYFSSDTWTEVMIAYTICRDSDCLTGRYFKIHAVGFFPHSLKVVGCW